MLNVGMLISPAKDGQASLGHTTTKIVLGEEGAKTRNQTDCKHIIYVKYLLPHWVLSEIVAVYVNVRPT